MSDDSEESLRDRVLRESLNVGYPFEVARLIADACVREGNDASARLASVAASYDAKHMVPHFLDHRVAFNEGKQMLRDAAGKAKRIDFQGTFRIQRVLQQRAPR